MTTEPINNKQRDGGSQESSVCACPVAGWCETHQRTMTVKKHAECRDVPGMFAVFQRLAKRPKPKPRRSKDFIGPPRPPLIGPPKPPKKSTPCGGCAGRKKKMNAILPGSGDLVEKITTKTGIKDWWERRKNA